MPDKVSSASPAPTAVLPEDELGWMEMILSDVDASAHRVLDPWSAAAVRVTGLLPDGSTCAAALELRLDPGVAEVARSHGSVRLTDSEGAPVAELTVEGSAPAQDGGHALWGPLTGTGSRLHHDHADLRRVPGELRAAGPWAALWAEPPWSEPLLSAAASQAERAGLPLLHLVTLAPSQTLVSGAHLGARLARHLRKHGDHAALLPVPEPAWDAAGLLVRVRVAASCGVRVLLLEPGRLARCGDPTRAREVAGRYGVELVELDPSQAVSAAELLALVHGEVEVPPAVLAPELAEEVRAVCRPRSRQGYTVFFTGLSGSGKSTLARRLVARLMERERRSVTLLDGDVVRLELSKGLGFSRADRETNVRRLGFVGAEVTKAGGVAVCCPIAPEDAVRRAVRTMVEPHGTFLLVHVATPLEECERRDRKGLYARARAGQIPEFTGISSPYEPPEDAELVIDTTGADLDECVEQVMDLLVRRRLLS